MNRHILEERRNYTPEQALQADHQDMVASLLKPAIEVYNQLTLTKIDCLHSAFGISGEAGELLDATKKYVFYNKPIDRENVVEELGDLEFYMEALRKTLLITREETLKANMDKLAERYKKFQYSDKAAIERADKVVVSDSPFSDLPVSN